MRAIGDGRGENLCCISPMVHSSGFGPGSDRLFTTAVYQHSLKLIADAWNDGLALQPNAVAFRIASQLYRAVGSIAANIAEGYGRRSNRDRARLYEYALGSAREARVWYVASQPVLGLEAVEERLNSIDNISRLLIKMITSERSCVRKSFGLTQPEGRG